MHTYNKHDLMPKTTFYRTNGTGRDTYIWYNNGGSVQNLLKNIGVRRAISFPQIPNGRPEPKSLHYFSDGSGRDRYITVSDGGLHCDGQPYGQAKFQAGLRNYKRIQGLDEFEKFRQTWMVNRTRSVNKLQSKKVADCVNRLYPKSNIRK